MSDETVGPLEAVYDAEIAPLMQQIIAIAKRANLPMFASFRLDGDLACTTYISPPRERIADDDRAHHERWRKGMDLAAREANAVQPSPLSIVTRGANGAIRGVEVVL